MSDRPRFRSEVVHRIPPGGRRRPRGSRATVHLAWLLIAGVACGVLFLLVRPSSSSVIGTPAITSLTPAASATPAPTAADTPEPPEPTSTFFAPLPTPTALTTPAPTQVYASQSGDTLPALAAHFGVNPADIRAPQGLKGRTTLEAGQLLIIPRVLDDLGPSHKIVPDSELVFSAGGAGFDPQKFAQEQAGYLAHYAGFADKRSLSGGDVLQVNAEQHSINPRLLMALLEYQSGWVTNPRPAGDALTYPLGYVHEYRRNLYSQLNWAARLLATGYYGWRAGTLTELQFADGTTLRLDPTLNAGTVALQYFFAQTRNRPQWDEAVGPDGFAATYRQFFGDPFARVVPLIPADLTQPPLALPFEHGHTWYFSGGPHGAKSGKMALLVGGDERAFNDNRRVLDAIGDQVIYIGAIGAGTVAKLVHNCAGYAIQTALAEVFTVGVKAGVDPLALWAAVRQCSLGRQRTFDRLGRQFLQGSFDPPDFALKLALKDVTLATDLGRELGVPMRVANLAHADMTEALNRGWAERDSRVAMLLQEERAGVQISVPAAEIQKVLQRDG